MKGDHTKGKLTFVDASLLCICANPSNKKEREGVKERKKEAYPHRGPPANLLLQTEPVIRVGGRRSLKRKMKGVCVQFFCGLSGIDGGKILGEGPGATGFFGVTAEKPELHIRRSEPVKRDDNSSVRNSR